MHKIQIQPSRVNQDFYMMIKKFGLMEVTSKSAID